MIYILDGHNILGLTKGIDSETARDQFIALIRSSERLYRHTVVIFFDGFNAFSAEGPYSKNIKIYYAGERTADEAIVEYIRHAEDSREMIVVTKDRELQREVRYYGSRTMDNEQFLKYMNAPRKSVIRKGSSSKEMPFDAKKITDELKKLWLKDKKK